MTPTTEGDLMSGAHAREHVVTGRGGSALDSLVEQLWLGPVESGAVRVVVDAAPGGYWADAESYWVLPSLQQPRILIPRGNRKVTRAALQAYRSLRPVKVNLARTGLGALVALGLPPSLHSLSVQTPARAVDYTGGPVLPLEDIAENLGTGPLTAAIGIRLGDNRKPTLQLFTAEGRPAGYAKLAWDESSRRFVETEIAALEALGGGAAHASVPELLATGKWDSYPYLVTSPLPQAVRAVRGRVAPPTPAEMYSLCPVVRFDRLITTAHFQQLSWRLLELSGAAEGQLAGATRRLEQLVRARDVVVPVSARWHGDLVPWNAAREPSGRFWCWDWESAEDDAVAGLDALHWEISVRREAGLGTIAGNLFPAVHASAPYLFAAGMQRSAWDVLAAVYALVVAERAQTLAVQHGSWAGSWLGPAELLDLLRTAAARLS